jgi:multiple sugar transport system permease protein
MSRKTRVTTLQHTVLILVCLLFLAPVAWLADTALKTEAESAAAPLHWLPTVPQWHNFSAALHYIPFLGYARNSLIIALILASLTTLSSAFVGFGFARLRARGRDALFGLVIATLMLPTIVTLIPTYVMLSRVHLVNTYWPWVLWGLAANASFVFLFRQFFRTLPMELEEAALLDGCSWLHIWRSIFMPLAKPVAAACFILTFVQAWGDFIGPQLFLRNDTTTLAVAVASDYVDPQSTTINHLVAAGALMFAAPVVIMFLLLQRYFVQGIATAGMK